VIYDILLGMRKDHRQYGPFRQSGYDCGIWLQIWIL